MKSIKIGRNEYEIKKGDYILYNGACYQFITSDKRMLKFKNHQKIDALTIPKTTIKKIPLDLMQKKSFNYNGVELVRWIF